MTASTLKEMVDIFSWLFELKLPRRRIGLPLVSVILAVGINDAQATTVYDIIALEDQVAPGADPEAKFEFLLDLPALNDGGQAAFTGSLTGVIAGTSYDQAAYVANSSGVLRLVAKTGQPAPHIGEGIAFTFVGGGNLNDAGEIMFTAGLAGRGIDNTNDVGIFSESQGEYRLIARKGDAAPDAEPDAKFGGFIATLFNDAGKSAFGTSLVGTSVDSTNDIGIYSGEGGTMSLVAREGDSIPAMGSSVTFKSISSHALRLNGGGQIAFFATLLGPNIDFSNNSGIFAASGSTVRPVVLEGDIAPTPGEVRTFRYFGWHSLNDLGQIAFHAGLSGSTVNNYFTTAIFSEDAGTLSLVAQAGNPAPGTEPGVHFASVAFPVLNNSGQTAFFAELSDANMGITNSSALYVTDTDGVPQIVARTGELAPGTEAGVRFGSFNDERGNGVNLSNTTINDLGQTAFLARLSGPGLDNTNSIGLFASDGRGSIHLIAREGDLFDVDPDPLVIENRTIRRVYFRDNTGSSGGQRSSLNNAGQIAFRLDFIDGTRGIFVATLGVPEPRSVILITTYIVALPCYRRR